MWKLGIEKPQRKVGIALAAGFVAVGLAMSGCSAGTDAVDAKSDALQKILDRGTINIGSCLSQPPWGLINTAGEPDGYDVDLAKAIAKDLGVELNTVEVTSASRIPSLQSGKVDLISCSFTVTEERKAQIDFSDPTILSGNSLAVRTDSDITNVEDLSGKSVAVSKGGTSIAVTELANPDAKQQAYESFSAALLALQQGQADAMIDTASVLADGVKDDENLKIVVDGGVGEKVDFALGVKKDQPELLARVNEFVKKFHAEKTGSELYKKWYETEATYQFEGLE